MGFGRTWGVIIALAALLAGCAEPDAPAARASTAAEPLDTALLADATDVAAIALAAEAEAPEWSVGDAWAVVSRGAGEEERGFLVVTAADSGSYTIGTSSEQAAGWDAIHDVSYIGRIRAHDLAGHQQGEPVQYFDFPLAEGKTWSTKWDGFEVVLTATKTPRGFDIVGLADGAPYVEYDYSPEMKWWTRLHFVQGDYGLTIERLQPEWRGTLASGTGKVVYEAASETPAAMSGGSGAFTIDEGQTFAMATLSGGGSHWARAFGLTDPSGMPYPTTSIENAEAEGMGPRGVFLQERLPPTPGQWHVAAPAVHDPEGGFSLVVHQVAIVTKAFPS
jgi:hypothetical protein